MALQAFLAEAEVTVSHGAVMEAEEVPGAMQHPGTTVCKGAAHALALVQDYMARWLMHQSTLGPLVVEAIRNLEPRALAVLFGARVAHIRTTPDPPAIILCEHAADARRACGPSGRSQHTLHTGITDDDGVWA